MEVPTLRMTIMTIRKISMAIKVSSGEFPNITIEVLTYWLRVSKASKRNKQRPRSSKKRTKKISFSQRSTLESIICSQKLLMRLKTNEIL